MPRYSLRRLAWVGPLSTMAAILADLLYYLLTKTLGEQYLIPMGMSSPDLVPMPFLMLVSAILITGLVATVFFGLLIRFAQKPATIFLSVAIAALLLSFGGPINLPSASMETKILLSGMNILAAGIITGGMLFLSHKEG